MSSMRAVDTSEGLWVVIIACTRFFPCSSFECSVKRAYEVGLYKSGLIRDFGSIDEDEDWL